MIQGDATEGGGTCIIYCTASMRTRIPAEGAVIHIQDGIC